MRFRLWILSSCCLLGISCAPDTVTLPPLDEASWRAELLADRAAKDAEFANSRTSPMAGALYLGSDPTERVTVSFDGESFALGEAEGSETVLRFDREEGGWRWQGLAEPETPVELLTGSTLFSFGRFTLRVDVWLA